MIATTQDNEAIATYLATVEADMRAALAKHPTVSAAELIAEVQSYQGPRDGPGDRLATMADHAAEAVRTKAYLQEHEAELAAMTPEVRSACAALELSGAIDAMHKQGTLASFASVVSEFSPANYQR